MPYVRRTWQNAPSSATPLNAAALNNIEDGVEEAVDAVRDRLSEANLAGTIGAVGAEGIAGDDYVPDMTMREAVEAVAATVAPPLDSLRAVVPPQGIVFLTDSIGAYNANTGQAWHRIMCTLSLGRLLWRGYFGTGGYTLTQIRDTHLPQALAMSPLPGAVAICGGTNDVGAGGYNEATSRAVLLDIIEQLKNAGIKPVLWTLPPRADSGTANGHVQRWNVWLRYLAGANNYPLIDSHAVLVDEATGNFISGYSDDGVHPTRVGHFQLGKSLALNSRFMEHFPTNGVYLSASKGADPSLIATNARFFDAGVNGNGAPWNWTTSLIGATNAAAGSIVTDTAIPGNWWRMTKTPGSNTGFAGLARADVAAGPTTFAAGDRVAFAVRFKISAPESAAEGFGAVILQARTAGGSVLLGVGTFEAGGDNLDGIAYLEGTLPAGTEVVRVEMQFSGLATSSTQWVQYAQPTLLNLTALGVS